jgi:hypothetical protein
MFDCACNIFVVLTRGFLLPKQMLYQAELRPDLDRQGPGGPGIVAGSLRGAINCTGIRQDLCEIRSLGGVLITSVLVRWR